MHIDNIQWMHYCYFSHNIALLAECSGGFFYLIKIINIIITWKYMLIYLISLLYLCAIYVEFDSTYFITFFMLWLFSLLFFFFSSVWCFSFFYPLTFFYIFSFVLLIFFFIFSATFISFLFSKIQRIYLIWS